MSLFYTVARWASRRVGPNSWLGRAARPASEQLLRWNTRDSGLAWEINGIPCRIDPDCRSVMHPMYDAPVAAYLRSRVKPGAVCFDVGANVGVWVIQFAHYVGASGRVVAFEPNPGARALLEKHVSLNRLEAQVTVVPAAVSAVAGEATLFAAAADGMSRLAEPNPALGADSRPITVPVVTLDDYCDRHRTEPDWIFLDIEGFECEALRGARQLMARRGADLGIVVEMHPSGWPSANTSRAEFEALLSEFGRRAVPLAGQADPLGEYGIVALEPAAS